MANGEFDGDVIARKADAAAEARLGDLAGLVPGNPAMNGVLVGGLTGGFVWGVRPEGAPGAGPGKELRLYDLANRSVAGPDVLRVVWDTARARYVIAPGTLGQQAELGERDFTRRFLNVYSQEGDFANGVRERSRSARIDEFTTPAFNAGDFTAVGGGSAWTVAAANVSAFQYSRSGRRMFFSFRVSGTTVAGTPNELNILLPGNVTAAEDAENTIRIVNGGAAGYAHCRVIANGNVLKLFAGAGENVPWTARAGALGQISFETTN
jgi:hypothetical protein